MALNLSQKQEVVAELADVAAKAHSLVAAEYAGITVSQMTAMRKKARESGVYVRVVKNTLASRAVAGTEYEVVKDKLERSAAVRVLEGGSRRCRAPDQGVRQGQRQAARRQRRRRRRASCYPAAHVEVLASLPTREQALAMLARVLTEPVTMFARAVEGRRPTSKVAASRSGRRCATSPRPKRPKLDVRIVLHPKTISEVINMSLTNEQIVERSPPRR